MFNLRWVPLPVLEKALSEKQHREIVLFLYLKMTTSSRVKIEGRKKSEIMQVLSISESTLYRRLDTLREWDWVGYDEITGVYSIRGFKRIYELEKFKGKTAVYLRIDELYHFQVFSFAACVGYLVRQQSSWKRRGAGRKTWRSKQSPAYVFKPVAISVMENLFKLSKDTIISLKEQAIDLGYLLRERGYTLLHEAKYHDQTYYMAYPEHWGRLRRVRNFIVLLGPDRLSDKLYYRRKKYS